MSSAPHPAQLAQARPHRLNSYIALTKPDVSFLVLMTTGAGYYMGVTGPVSWLRLVQVVFATMLIAAGTAALNHYIERETDRHMRRTASRPLPSGLLSAREALLFGIALCIAGALDLYFTAGWLPCALGIVTCVSYLLAYTPLKTRTVWATFIGAFPGAVPPMIGWTAATGKLDAGAWRVVVRVGTRTYRQIVLYAAGLVAVSLLRSVLGFAGVLYFFGALVTCVALVQVCLWAAHSKSNVRAKWLMHVTVMHIPILLGLMMWDKLPR